MSWRFCSQRCWSRWARRPGAEFNLATGWWRMPRSPRPRPARMGPTASNQCWTPTGVPMWRNRRSRASTARWACPTSRPTASGPSTPCRCSIPSAIPTSLSRERISADQAREIAAASQQVPLPTGTSDVSTLDLQAPGTSTAVNGGAGQGQVQAGGYGSGQMMPAPPPPNTAQAPGAPGWQDALKRELAHCATQGFFERPSCSWAARNKYCAPNRAWGTMAECPARPQ